MRAGGLEAALDVVLLVSRSEERALHDVVLAVGVALLAEELMPTRQRGPDSAAGVAGGRLDPDVLERTVAENLAVGDAIERDAAGQAQVLEPVLARERA